MKSRPNTFGILGFVLVATVLSHLSRVVATEAVTAEAPLVDGKIRQLMQDRDYAAAIEAIDVATVAKDAPHDYLAYLKGRALYLGGKHDEAITLFDQFAKDFPKSQWSRRARFGKAVALARKGDFRSAEQIYRAEADYLLSSDRKQQIADIYLEFAETYFKPPKDTQKPDYAKALEFFQKALEVGPKPEKRIEVELLVAQCQQNLSKWGEAANLYEKFSKENPQHPLDIEARYRLGECRLAENNRREARRVWQDLLAQYPDSQSSRIADARFNLPRTWGIPQPNTDEELNLGVAALEAFIERFPKHKLASQAHLQIAQSYIHRGRFDDAQRALKQFLSDTRYADQSEMADGQRLLGRAFQLQKKFSEALAAWHEFLAKYPTHNAWSEVQREIIDTEYLMAVDRLEAKQYEAAQKLFAEFLEKYPLDPRNPRILLQMNQKNVVEEKWDAAIAQWRRLVSKYANTEEASRAQLLIADTLEKKLGKLEEALEEYRKVTWGSAVGEARQAIARLTAKTMSIATERVFRSDETPKVKLVTRNIESVTVRAYKVDLETYFRKMHLARGVEGLDIALIDPDKTFEFKIPKYAKHQELESAVDLPLPADAKAGVMAITVSSKTLEATTLVIQSDLDVIVKSSRDEIFVFAENMLTGKPWAEAKLLISNGKEVIAEVTTDKDGVFHKSYKDLTPAVRQPAAAGAPTVPGASGGFEARDVRVFALAGGCVASNVVDLQGIGVARGLADRGYIYTDRPAYRPGQLVNIRGCLRHAVDDAYTVEKDKKYTVEVFDARGRLVRQEEAKLNDFGSFHIHFVLPPSSPQGQYRVLVRDNASQNYQGTFQVHQYQIEPVRITVDTPRRVYYRGEPIEGVIRAEYYYGAPVVGREIRYQLASDRLETAVTDAKGEVHFKLLTREYSETQALPIVVQLPERNVQTAVNFFLAAQGFSINVTTVRPVYIAGETFEATLTVKDAEGKPIAEKLTLKVLEQTNVDGKLGERLVEERAVETDKADGVARATLKLEKGGRFLVRAEGVDRFHNPISGQYLVQISDEEDAVRLRILADKHTFKVGDMAAVKLLWREEPALALVTFQGARVLDYKLVTLKKGENVLELPMTAALAPNFELAVAVMTDPRPELLQQNAAAKARVGVADPKSGVSNLKSEISNPKSQTPDAKSQISDAKSATPDPKSQISDLKSEIPVPKPIAKKPIVRFHAATSPFTVQRDLRLKIVAKRKGEALKSGDPLRPGEEVEVAIVATDPQGKPVAAEISLAMVEQSLLERFGSSLPSIDAFFRGEPRQSAVRTTATITFTYKPTTQPINPRLLAEADREELTREEEESRRTAVAATMLRSEDGSRPQPPVAVVVPGLAGEPSDAAEDMVFEEAQQDGANQQWSMQSSGQVAAFGGANALPSRQRKLQQGQQQMAMGRQIQSLPMMATPGIVVQDEEENGLSINGAGTVNLGGIALGEGRSGGRGVRRSGDGGFYYSYAYDGSSPGNQPAPNSYALGLGGGNDFGGNSTINGTALTDLVLHNGGQIAVVDRSGNFRNLRFRGDELGGKKAEALAAEFNASGAILLSALLPQETAYWNPAIATDKEGKATISFVVPERSTAWKLLAKGITMETLAGEASDDVKVKKDLFGELKLPLAFTDGDEADVQVTVHNDAVEKGPIEVVLKTTIADRTVEEKKTIEATGKGVHELSFKVLMKRPTAAAVEGAMPPEVHAEFALSIKAAGREDLVRAEIPLEAYGMKVYATASGSASADTTAFVDPPKNLAIEAPGMQILVGPTVERSLLDIVLAPALACQLEVARIASGIDAATSDLMASLGLQKLVGGSRDAGSPEAQALDGRIRASISLLVSAQNDDGGWTWTGTAGSGNRYASCRIAWALTLARRAGYMVPDDSFNKMLAFLRAQVAATDNADYESKAMLLHALAVAGQGDFALANRLYRDRPSLSTAALAHLALAFAAMDRKATADEILTLVAERNLDDATTRRTSAKGDLPWSNSPVELRALYALALEETGAKSPKTKELVDWLMAHRTGHRWSPDKATGPAALAVSRWFAESRFAAEHYKLTIFVNDVQVKILDVDKDIASEVIDVPAKFLAKGRQRVNFQITGRGRYTYQCIFGGFVPAEKLVSTMPSWSVHRIYEPAPLEMDGREIPRGFDVLEGGYNTFRNPLEQLAVGRRGHIDLELWRNDISYDTPDERLEYIVVTEPIPSGATVIEKSVQGPFERYEIGPGEITFYVGNRRSIGTIHYEIYGYLPGKYRAAPTVIRNAHRPEQFAVAPPKTLTVLPLGGKSADAYRLTPRELYELGKRYFEKKDYKTAVVHLGELLEKWNLRAEVYKDTVRMLLDSHLEVGPPAKIVHYFEIIKEKWPAEEIPFAKIVKVGAAYHEIGEYERSYLVFRATVESSFLRESTVAGFLQAQGEFMRSVEVMSRLLAEYPPESYVAAATYALAQQVYAKAPEAAGDAKLRQQKFNRVDLVRRAWTMLENFLTAYPDDPAADQGGFAAANALLEMKAYKEAAAACNRYVKRYPKSDLVDSYWYIIGFAEFATGQHKAALEMCRKVADMKRTDKATGRETESPNKWRAIYILGQIYHSLGEAADAIREYRLVEDRFADAKEAIAYFLRKAIELPEVTTVKPGDPAEVALKFRNIAACDMKVYRIDLMKFSLLKRNLAGIAQINLAGIRPLHEAAVKLGEGKDYRDRTQKLILPLKDEGAYLVVCRGDDLHASGLVLVTPLVVEIQEEPASGRIRTTVKDTKAEQYVHNVHVKVIGSRNDDFVSGATDLRGVFVADGIRGKSTVIARAEDARYAFYRGQADLGPEPAKAAVPQQAPATAAGKPSAAAPAVQLEKQLLEQLQETNSGFQRQQGENLKQMYQNKGKGVEAKAAF